MFFEVLEGHKNLKTKSYEAKDNVVFYRSRFNSRSMRPFG